MKERTHGSLQEIHNESQTSINRGVDDARNGDENAVLLVEKVESVSSEACTQSTLDVLAVDLKEMVQSKQ